MKKNMKETLSFFDLYVKIYHLRPKFRIPPGYLIESQLRIALDPNLKSFLDPVTVYLTFRAEKHFS